MTAEIAVMNKGAIALAADSKVTVTSGGITKTYDTVSKLFTLSKVAPVGIMIYGNADFMGYPWETIIKLYRQGKGDRTEKTILKWASDFFLFLNKFGKITKSDRENNTFSICLATLHDAVSEHDRFSADEDHAYGGEEYEESLCAYLAFRAKQALEIEEWVPEAKQDQTARRLMPIMAQAISEVLSPYSEETQKQGLLLLVASLLLKNSSPQVSGVVIAGFGDDEYFPTLVEYQTDGYVGTSVKTFLVHPVMDLSRTRSACVRAFAQREMVSRFMDGIDPYYSSYLSSAIPKLVIENCFETLEKYGSRGSKNDENRGKIEEAVQKAVEEFDESARKYRWQSFADPVVSMVSVLPKDELAHLAESLVALTSLKRRVSSDAETVGGPIDVALISKGDGFVWIKRKHYFREELNRQFVRNYMNGVDNGEGHDAKREPLGGSRRKPPRRSLGSKAAKGKDSEKPAAAGK